MKIPSMWLNTGLCILFCAAWLLSAEQIIALVIGELPAQLLLAVASLLVGVGVHMLIRQPDVHSGRLPFRQLVIYAIGLPYFGYLRIRYPSSE